MAPNLWRDSVHCRRRRRLRRGEDLQRWRTRNSCMCYNFLLTSADTHPHPLYCHAARCYAAGEIVDKSAGCDLVRDFAYYLSFSLLPLLRSTSPVCLPLSPGSWLECDQVCSLKGGKVVVSYFCITAPQKTLTPANLVEINPTTELSFAKGHRMILYISLI